jgi:hypothetical protein
MAMEVIDSNGAGNFLYRKLLLNNLQRFLHLKEVPQIPPLVSAITQKESGFTFLNMKLP